MSADDVAGCGCLVGVAVLFVVGLVAIGFVIGTFH